MSDEESIDDNFYDQINDMYDWRSPLARLSTRLRASNNFLRTDSDIYTNAVRRHRDKTLDSVLKLYREASRARYRRWFKRTADQLAVMHRMVSEQVDDVFRSGFENGTLAFSQRFFRDLKRRLEQQERLHSNLVVPDRVLETLLVRPNDPALGAFKRARPTLRTRRVSFPRATQSSSQQTQETTQQQRQIGGLDGFYCCCSSSDSSSSSSSLTNSSPSSSSSELERS